MSSRHSRHRPIRPCPSDCGTPGEEDGLDRRRYFRPESGRKRNRKDLQLCEQVAHTLQYVLSGATGDDLLRDLVVIRVVPAPNGSRLLAFVASSSTQPQATAGEIAARLAAFKTRLRAEIAASVNRRKVPDLAFQVVALDADGGAP